MAQNSSIEWTDTTWNPVTGCTRASEGCDNCYAVTMTNRLEAMGQEKYSGLTVLNPRGDRHFNGQVREHGDVLKLPFAWRKPRRVFVNSMSDLFHRGVDFRFIAAVFGVAAALPKHTFQILTKRPEVAVEFMEFVKDKRGRHAFGLDSPAAACCDALHHYAGSLYNTDYFPASGVWPLPNVLIGASIENQDAMFRRMHSLRRIAEKGWTTFISAEPLLGPIRFPEFMYWDDESPKSCWLDWCIVGCESGPRRRPMETAWARSIRDQCKAAGVAFFMKQLEVGLPGKVTGGMDEFPEDLRIRESPSPGAIA